MPGQFVNIDRLWQGESGQAAWQRKVGNVSASRNVRFDPRLGGSATRNPSTLITDLLPGSSEQLDASATYFWTAIRGAVIAIGIGGSSSSSSILAWDENGQPLTVIDNTSGGMDTYLSTVLDPVRDIDVTTSFDTLIITNRLRSTGGVQRAFTFDQTFNFLKNGDPGSSADTVNDRTTPTFNFLSDLEDESPVEGDVFKVLSDENLDPAGFYIYFPDDPHADYVDGFFPQHDDFYRIPNGKGAGQRRARYQNDLMPHRLVYDEPNATITVATCPWRQRVSGNRHSNPSGLFKNKPIVAVEFLGGRLFLVGPNSVSSSRTNDFFNLFKDSVNAPQDNDPISQQITQSNVGEALRAKACGAALFIVAENGQLQYGTIQENLTNVNGILETITDLPSDNIDPATGPSWVSILDRYGDIHQYGWSSQSRNINYQDMLTAHVAARFHNLTVDRIFHFGTTFMAVVSGADASVNDIFVVGGNRVQSAWGTLELFETPVYFNAWQGNIRIVTQSATEGFSLLHYVHRLLPPPAGMTYIPRQDRQELVASGAMTYDASADETTIPHTGRNGSLTGSILVTTDSGGAHEFVIPKSIDSSGDPVFPGKRDDASQYLGFLFTHEVELSKLFPPGDPRAVRVQSASVYYFDTSNFEVIVTRLGDRTESRSFHGGNVGQLAAGDVPFRTGIERFGMTIDPRVSTITLRSQTPGQFILTQVVFELRPEGQPSKV